MTAHLKSTQRRRSNLTIPSLLLFAISLLLVSQASYAQQYKKITRLGTSQAVCRGGVETLEQLQTYFANNPSAIRAILADSGWSGSADALLQAVANGELTERAFPSGSRFAWMGASKGGQYVALPYREWAGSRSFEAFEANISTDCQVYQIVIPKDCCNVALASVQPDTSAECVAPEPVAVTPEPEVIEEPEPAPAKSGLGIVPFIGAFAGSETRPRFETAWAMDMKDSSGIYGLKGGLMKPLNEKTALTGTLSAYKRNGINGGNVYPKNNFAVDLGIERKLSESAFIGGGIGAWNVDDSDYRDASLFGMVGGDIGQSNVQWFLEGRVFDSDSKNHDSLSENKMFSAGLRYLIK